MTRIKRPSATAVLALCTIAGIGCLVAGAYLWAGLAVALLVAGAFLVAVGLLVDA